MLNERELLRHERLTWALLFGGLVLWAVGAGLRMRQAWVPEYPHAMIGLAAVMVFSALVWRYLAFFQPLWSGLAAGNQFARMARFLSVYSLAVVVGVAWLGHEKRNLPDIAWMREHGTATLVMYGLLFLIVPWVLWYGAYELRLKHRGKR